MHDRIIEALELSCRRGEMLRIQNNRVDWDTHTIGIPGHTAKDKRIGAFGSTRMVVSRRCCVDAKLGANAFVFGTKNGAFVANFKTA
jgi:hypothetical protein